MSYFTRSIQKFDPNQARDYHGRWTDGGGESAPKVSANDKGVSFVSPNVDNLDFQGAVDGLATDRQKGLMAASAYIDGALGMTARDAAIIGAWSDGAENSVMTTVEHSDFETLKLAAAMKGYIADQKAVLVFQEDDVGGKSVLYSFDAKGELSAIHANLIKDGVQFHTLVPTDGGAKVFVADLDGSAADAVATGAKRYGSQVDFTVGHAEFIGTAKEDGTDRQQRDDAKGRYSEVIRTSGVQSAEDVWQRVYHRYGAKLEKAQVSLRLF